MAIPKLPFYDIKTAAKDYPNRANWQIQSERAVLLVHDMQEYFVGFYGKQSPLVDQLIANIQELKAQCKAQGIPVVYTAQPPHQRAEDRALLTDFWGTGLSDADNQHEIVTALRPDEDDVCLSKWRYSAFQRSALHQLMHERRRDQIIVCGVYAHIGILATCMEAFMTDIQAFLVVDAVADFSEQDHQMATRYIANRCGSAVTLEQVTESVAQKQQPNLSLSQIKADIGAMLQISPHEIDNNELILNLGLDSIRLMDLIERWRAAGADLQFADLAERQTLGQWWQFISARVSQENADAAPDTEEAVHA